MTPEQALEFLFGCTTLARLTKEDHVRCQESNAILAGALQRLLAGQQDGEAEDKE